MNPKTKAALEALAEQNKGVLVPEHVVAAAQDRRSPLHKEFTWDDGEAAHLFRLGQARSLIRLVVTEVPNTGGRRSREFVSLRIDRVKKGGGYRKLTVVLSDQVLRKHLLRDALDDLQTFEQKYASLTELADVFKAVRKARLMHKSDEGR